MEPIVDLDPVSAVVSLEGGSVGVGLMTRAMRVGLVIGQI